VTVVYSVLIQNSVGKCHLSEVYLIYAKHQDWMYVRPPVTHCWTGNFYGENWIHYTL